MIVLDDDESKSVKKFIKYSEDFESVIIHLKNKNLSIEIIIGDNLTIFEIRDDEGKLVHRDRVSLTKLKGVQELMRLSKDAL